MVPGGGLPPSAGFDVHAHRFGLNNRPGERSSGTEDRVPKSKLGQKNQPRGRLGGPGAADSSRAGVVKSSPPRSVGRRLEQAAGVRSESRCCRADQAGPGGPAMRFGFFGVALAAFIATRTGRAGVDFFLGAAVQRRFSLARDFNRDPLAPDGRLHPDLIGRGMTGVRSRAGQAVQQKISWLWVGTFLLRTAGGCPPFGSTGSFGNRETQRWDCRSLRLGYRPAPDAEKPPHRPSTEERSRRSGLRRRRERPRLQRWPSSSPTRTEAPGRAQRHAATQPAPEGKERSIRFGSAPRKALYRPGLRKRSGPPAGATRAREY